ncbi:leucine-rich repeat neuronal protein 1 [Musca domestica]|uniref:Leucine-rich repeat neuronal protein 1 n=1 Tax=Musca domestica TaxID=7370 RepID=A0ABM3V5B9_MUSDO|nr:leucine-rich repeat neuronal protein 1 [Musca domestica]
MYHPWSLIAFAACCLLVCNFNLLQVQAEGTTQKAVPLASENSTSTTVKPATTKAPVTTPTPKIKIADSPLCKSKCHCDLEYFQIDCSGKSMNTLFSQEEWDTLLNGDVIFTTIKLNNNSITHIPSLPSYPVENLYLSFNQINNITLGAFQNLTKLAKLDLSHNNLTKTALQPDVFKGPYATDKYEPLNSLIELDLAHNELHSLHGDLFEHLPNLEILILCENVFQVIDTPTLVALASLSSVKTLDMSFMELSDLPETIFHSPNKLETLLLSGNLFREIPVALKWVKNLKKLVLDENLFGDIVKGNFTENLNTVEYLSIAFLPDTTKIGPGALNVFTNMTTLIASDNPHLSSIHELAFTKNTANPEIFVYPPLKHLYLNNNNLSVVERNWFQRWDQITTIDLRFNPWTCDCNNRYLIHTLIKQINTTSAPLAPEVLCATPPAWKGKSLLQLSTDNKELICENTNHPGKDGVILISLLVGVLIGIPLTLGALVIYRRGCFGLLNRVNPSAPRYNRASFTDDFHI